MDGVYVDVEATDNSGKNCDLSNPVKDSDIYSLCHIETWLWYNEYIERPHGYYLLVISSNVCVSSTGMSVLQCASVALKATVCELESSKSLHHTRIHTLRQEQMMETLECLLQMGSYIHTMVGH